MLYFIKGINMSICIDTKTKMRMIQRYVYGTQMVKQHDKVLKGFDAISHFELFSSSF